MDRIELSNFKVFGNKTEFNFAPITILTGKNNSGKSSLVKAVLLLSDFVNSDNQTILSFEGPFAPKHKVSFFKNALTWKTSNKQIRFAYQIHRYSFALEVAGQDDIEQNFGEIIKFTVTNLELNESLTLEKRADNVYYLEVGQTFLDGLTQPMSRLRTRDTGVLDPGAEREEVRQQILNLEELIPTLGKAAEQYAMTLSQLQSLKRRLSVLNSAVHSRTKSFIYKKELTLEPDELATLTLPSIIRRALMQYENDERSQSERAKIKDTFSGPTEMRNTLFRVYDLLTRRMAFQAYHLSPNRFYQARMYHKQETASEINRIVNEFSQIPLRSEAKRFLSDWLEKFGIGTDIRIAGYEGEVSKIEICKEEQWLNLADLGFGSGQLLVILLQITLLYSRLLTPTARFRIVRELPILLIEEPEANAHPRLQSLLAELLVDAFRLMRPSGIRFILETHSEYLIRRLQLLVAEGAVDPSTAIIYYLDPANANEEDRVKKMGIGIDGKLSNSFGPGFFNEADEKAMELYRIQKRNLLQR